MPFFSRFSTWSFISDCSGEMTTVRPRTDSPAISAGIWNVNDFPPPVGKIAKMDCPSNAAFTAFSCNGSPPNFRKWS